MRKLAGPLRNARVQLAQHVGRVARRVVRGAPAIRRGYPALLHGAEDGAQGELRRGELQRRHICNKGESGLRGAPDQLGGLRGAPDQLGGLRGASDRLGGLRGASDRLGGLRVASDQRGRRTVAIGSVRDDGGTQQPCEPVEGWALGTASRFHCWVTLHMCDMAGRPSRVRVPRQRTHKTAEETPAGRGTAIFGSSAAPIAAVSDRPPACGEVASLTRRLNTRYDWWLPGNDHRHLARVVSRGKLLVQSMRAASQ
eukprot:9497573-Pyramimonas_sp.AAC.1